MYLLVVSNLKKKQSSSHNMISMFFFFIFFPCPTHFFLFFLFCNHLTFDIFMHLTDAPANITVSNETVYVHEDMIPGRVICKSKANPGK